MEHIKLFWSRLNIRKALKACEENAQWSELTFLYLHYDEFDNAALSMIAHPVEAWENAKFKDTMSKVTNTEIFYKAIDFYLQQQPLLLNDLLAVMSQRIDHVRVVSQLRKAPPSLPTHPHHLRASTLAFEPANPPRWHRSPDQLAPRTPRAEPRAATRGGRADKWKRLQRFLMKP